MTISKKMRNQSLYNDPLFDISGRVVVVTGAGGIIGRSLAKAFHQRGAKLLLSGTKASNPEKLAKHLGGETIGCVCDVSKISEVKKIKKTCLDNFGRVDVLINCHQHKLKNDLKCKAENFPENFWDEIINVNLKGTFLTCREFGQHMLNRGKGCIINFASAYGIVSSNPALYEDNIMGNPVAYSASKGGIMMLSKYLGTYWAKSGVRVNCVTPHGVLNNHEESFMEKFNQMSPMGRMMTAEEVVGATLFLACDASSYATASNVIIEGGWTAW